MIFHKNIFPILLFLTSACTAGEPVPTVDGRAALEKVKELTAVSPRDSGTDNARKAALWIADECEALNLPARIDTWEEKTANGKVTFQNVVAVFPGESPERVLIGSHYDTKIVPGVPDFQGANDSGSSTGLLLEMMRVIQASETLPPFTLEFVFFDGEECVHHYDENDGLRGSKHHARKIKDSGRMNEYKGMILLDMIGDADLSVTLSPDTPPELGAAVMEAASACNAEQYFSFSSCQILDDHVPFSRIGIPSVDIIDFRFGPNNSYWHTREDTIDKLSAESLEIVGNVSLRLIWDLK